MYSVLTLIFVFWFAIIHPKRLKYLVLRERAKEDVIFLHSKCTLYVALLKCIVSWFWSFIVEIFLKFSVLLHQKKQFSSFVELYTPFGPYRLYGAVYSSLYRPFLKCIASWFWFLFFDLPLFTTSCTKVMFFLKFLALLERSSNIVTSFAEHPIDGVSKM